MPLRNLRQHYIRAWREYRGLSLGKLALRLEQEPGKTFLTTASLSRIERGLQPYTQETLEALAEALNVEPWDLLHHDPNKEGDLVDLCADLPDSIQQQARAVIMALKKSA
jgi:transcriptional regulator with XRE-family HTH domain